MWERLLDATLRRVIRQGRLEVAWPDGHRSAYGAGSDPAITLKIADAGIARELCLRPVLALGEGYMAGRLQIGDDRLFEFLTLLVRNEGHGGMPPWYHLANSLRDGLRSWVQRNDPRRARRNVAHHYDLSDEFYRLFLDADMQYSCAYFARPEMTLEQAQEAKKAHVARKLLLEPGCRVLDVGCGWGGLALTLAREHGAHVTGVTLSENQCAEARRRAVQAGLAERCDFRLLDYRKLNGLFDRIVSIGMLEHVGLPHFETYFAKVRDLLKPDGVALIHTIGRVAPPRATSTWLEKYIFPGGYVPSLSDLAPALERSGLWTADIEVLRGHYGPTLNHWRQRFEDRVDEVREMYDDRFVRMWRFYLVACEMAFEERWQAVFQVQLSHDQHRVPATRDYLYRDGGNQMMHAAQ